MLAGESGITALLPGSPFSYRYQITTIGETTMKWTTLLFLFIASLSWGQYSTTYNGGVTDITSYLPTNSAWKSFPQGGFCDSGSLTIGGDGYIMCLSSGYPYATTAQGTWTLQTAMETNLYGLAVADQSHIYSLIHATCATDHNVALWSGTAWITKTGCLKQINAGSVDGTLVGTNSYWYAYQSTDGGNTYTEISGGSLGPYLSYIAASSSYSMCGVGSGNAYSRVGTQTAFTALPASGVTPIGCAIYQDANPGIFVWDAGGVVKLYDFISNSWSLVKSTIGMVNVASETKASTIALDTYGDPYHLNVYAGYMSGTTTGSLNGCPPPTTCNGGATHTGTLKITYPHGLAGARSQQTVSPTTNMNVSGFDFSPTCDPIFGDPSDPECFASVSSDSGVVCNVSQQTLHTPPAPPPLPKSNTYGEWDTSHLLMISEPWGNGGWHSEQKCGVTMRCSGTTRPVCPVATWDWDLFVPHATKSFVDEASLEICSKTGPWHWVQSYIPGQVPQSCFEVKVDYHVKVPQPCN
jgi:hypothetical protein